MLTPYLMWIKIGAVALVLLVSNIGTWRATSNSYQKDIAKTALNQEKLVNAGLLQREQTIKQQVDQIKDAGETHAKDQILINTLSDSLHTERLRKPVHIPVITQCPDGKAGSSTDRASGVLSDRVDAAFANFQDGVDGLIRRCDQLNIDTKQMNEVVK